MTMESFVYLLSPHISWNNNGFPILCYANSPYHSQRKHHILFLRWSFHAPYQSFRNLYNKRVCSTARKKILHTLYNTYVAVACLYFSGQHLDNFCLNGKCDLTNFPTISFEYDIMTFQVVLYDLIKDVVGSL